MNHLAQGLILWLMPTLVPAETCLRDLERFPPYHYCDHQRELMWKFKVWLMSQRDHPDFLTEQACLGLENRIAWAEKAYWAWFQLSYASDPETPWVTTGEKENALKHLRDYLGEDRYLAGITPPPVPEWALSKLDQTFPQVMPLAPD